MNCTWTEENPEGPTPNTYSGTCGIYWYIPDRNGLALEECEMNYFPKCGGEIIEVPYPVEVDDD